MFQINKDTLQIETKARFVLRLDDRLVNWLRDGPYSPPSRLFY